MSNGRLEKMESFSQTNSKPREMADLSEDSRRT